MQSLLDDQTCNVAAIAGEATDAGAAPAQAGELLLTGAATRGATDA